MHFFKKIVTNKQFLLIVSAVLAIIICIIYIRYGLPVQTFNSSPNTVQPSTASVPSNAPQISGQTHLSSADTAAINSLLMKTLHAENQSGVVYKSQNVQIEYVATDALFQAEILTTQIESAKQETETWLRLQGLSQQGICNLSLNFYLSGTVKENLPTNTQVNLLPDGC
jgi:hypothetical protein